MHLGLKSLARLLGVGAAVLLPLAASAPAQASVPQVTTTVPQCVVHSNPSMVEMGFLTTESSIADIIQVECRPIYSQQWVTIDATQLFNACQGTLRWTAPALQPPEGTSAQFKVQLDNDGNATAVVWGGPSCAPSKDRISASLNAPPFTTVATTFTVLPPRNTPPGISAHPATEVEDAVFSSVATVIQVEFPSVQAGKYVTVKSDELFARCGAKGGAVGWIGPEAATLSVGTPDVTVQLDNNGNAFVVAVGFISCASGTSTITAELQTVPYTTYVNTFTILSPRPTCTKTKCV